MKTTLKVILPLFLTATSAVQCVYAADRQEAFASVIQNDPSRQTVVQTRSTRGLDASSEDLDRFFEKMDRKRAGEKPRSHVASSSFHETEPSCRRKLSPWIQSSETRKKRKVGDSILIPPIRQPRFLQQTNNCYDDRATDFEYDKFGPDSKHGRTKNRDYRHK